MLLALGHLRASGYRPSAPWMTGVRVWSALLAVSQTRFDGPVCGGEEIDFLVDLCS